MLICASGPLTVPPALQFGHTPISEKFTQSLTSSGSWPMSSLLHMSHGSPRTSVAKSGPAAKRWPAVGLVMVTRASEAWLRRRANSPRTSFTYTTDLSGQRTQYHKPGSRGQMTADEVDNSPPNGRDVAVVA